MRVVVYRNVNVRKGIAGGDKLSPSGGLKVKIFTF